MKYLDFFDSIVFSDWEISVYDMLTIFKEIHQNQIYSKDETTSYCF